MKTKFITAAGVLMALWLIPPTNVIAAADLLILCNTRSQCISSARVGCREYCCPTWETQTEYTCPDYWAYNSISGLCERLGSGSGSDSTGAYTTTYTSCEPTTSTYDCYEPSDSSTVRTEGGLLYRCTSVALPNTCD